MANTWQRWKGIMKAYPFEEKRLAKWAPPYIVQPKYDGDRCRAVPLADGRFLLLSSEENPIFSVPHINQDLFDSMPRQEYDGELYSHQIFIEGGHELIHSIVSRTVNIHPRFNEMEFHIFDLVNQDSQIERLTKLSELEVSGIPLRKAPFWICNSLDDIKRVYDNLVGQGYEGIIIRHLYNQYETKRSTFLMKFKPKKKDEYKITGWREEISKDGIPKGRIGSLIMSSQTGDEFGVSAGLNDEDRARLWLIRNYLNGKTAVVHYQHLTNKGIPKGCFDLEVI